MHQDRTVWIVGDPEDIRSNEPRYHSGDCYVLDQITNRDYTQKIKLAELPETFTPCRICAPPRRSADASKKQRADQPPSVEPGCVVEVRDLATGDVSTVRIAESADGREEGALSPWSPRAAPLIGKSEGDEAEARLPNGAVLRLRVLSIEPRVGGGTRAVDRRVNRGVGRQGS